MRYSEPRPDPKPETRFKSDPNPRPDKYPIKNIIYIYICRVYILKYYELLCININMLLNFI